MVIIQILVQLVCDQFGRAQSPFGVPRTIVLRAYAHVSGLTVHGLNLRHG